MTLSIVKIQRMNGWSQRQPMPHYVQ